MAAITSKPLFLTPRTLLQSLTSLSHFSTTTTKPLIPTLQPSPEADQLSSLLIQHHNPYHPIESSLQLSGISLSPHLFTQTLLRLSPHSKIALSFFHWALHFYPPQNDDDTSDDDVGMVVDVHGLNVMVDILGKVRQFDAAWKLLAQVQNNQLVQGIHRNASVLIIIRRLIAAGYTRQAIRAFDDMVNYTECEPSKENFVYLLDTLCKYGYVRVAMEVFNKKKCGLFEVCVKVYTVLICGWCKIRRVDMGERLLREMVERGIEVNVVCYNVLLDGICRRASLHPDERFERVVRAAERVFDEMKERGIEPDVTSYSILIHVCSRAHKPDLVLERLEVMKEKGICPSVVTYTSVVKCLCSCGRLEEAVKLLNEMVKNGVTPTAATYNCFFKEFRGREDVEKALELYRRMKNEGACKPSLHTYHILVRMFVKLDRMEVVKEIWNDMREAGTGPDLDSYTVLIHGLIEKERWKEACEYFVQMIERGFLPQKVTFETLYKGLIQADKLRTWRRLKKKLDEESISFGSEFEEYHLKPYRR